MNEFSQSISTMNNSIVNTTIQYVSTVIQRNPVHISAAACFASALLILATVLGNTLVLSALFLDKRLHSPSFFLIANMATADLLLGISVLPFSSVLEILDDRWIFGQSFCSAWLALDVLCCTASIIALMAVSIDRYIGVTRPLKYGSIMTTRRTIYLIILVWTVSVLTSVVPLFGLTDREKNNKETSSSTDPPDVCKVNKNTFYTIFSSLVSFYIPVIILLFLYSRVYQEAKKQGEKLENERRRLYHIDYQIASEQIRQQENHSNGHMKLSRMDENIEDAPVTTTLLDQNCRLPQDEYQSIDENELTKNESDPKIQPMAEISNSVCSLVQPKNHVHRWWGQRLFSSVRRNSTLQSIHLPYYHHHHHQIAEKDELLVIKRKIYNLKREKKAFRTLVLILGALLICWLPFFVTLPLMSILKNRGMIKDENTENIWFKITFWLGYCNSALNPFVYAFSNRAIRRAFRQVIFPRCFCHCRKKTNPPSNRRQRIQSGSWTTENSQIPLRRTSSFSAECLRNKGKNDLPLTSPPTMVVPLTDSTSNTGAAVVSFADFLAETADDDNSTNEQLVDEQSKKSLAISNTGD